VAYYCSEFAVHGSLPLYGGGLGVLAGDFLKAASDLAVPTVGVGLLYSEGYFHQRLDVSGWQHEYWVRTDFERLPLVLVTDEQRRPLTIELNIRQRNVRVQVWRVDVGHVQLFLVDADVPGNDQVQRWTTARLYDGNPTVRLAQYVLLGVGGVRVLEALGVRPVVYHLNEGHPALAVLEVASRDVERGIPPREALERARERLRHRLERRGLGPAAVLAAFASPAAVSAAPVTLVESAVAVAVAFVEGRAAAGVSSHVLALADGGSPMILGKFATGLWLIPALVAGVVLAGTSGRPAATRADEPARPPAAARPAEKDKEKEVTPAEREAKWLAGEWKLKHVETNNEALLTKDQLRDARIVFKRDRAEVKGFEVLFVRNFSFKLDPRYLRDIKALSAIFSSVAGFPPALQWAGRSVWFPVRNFLLWGAAPFFGLAALAGVAWGVRALFRGRLFALAPVLVHTLFVLAYHGLSIVRAMRYWYPVYPGLAALAALLLDALARRSSDRAGWLARAARLAPAAAVAGTALCGFAFSRIYSRPVTRVAASDWIYRNVPPPARFANEAWDDGLPLPRPGHDNGPYAGPVLPMFDPDSEKKADEIVKALTGADGVADTSNRIYANVTRIPDVYPMSIAYNRALFEGRLGFERRADFSSYPSLGPIPIPDDIRALCE
jgi:hypothetical protein